MNEHERQADPAFDRLMAADPARHAPVPVQGVLRAKVDALIAEDPGGTPPGGVPTRTTTPAGHEQGDELALRRYRRRTPWLVAAAVAGIVAAGGGGYLAGESGAGPTAASEMAADQGAGEAADGPSVVVEPDRGDKGTGEAESHLESRGSEPLVAGGDLPTATGLVFHAGAGLSDAPTTAEVRVAGTSGESLGSYPVISEVEAVGRLGDPRFAGAVLGMTQEDPPAQEEAGPSTAPVPGGPLAWPVEDVTISSAALIEVRYTLPDGTVLLVPAYDLTDAEGNGWTVMAVDEELLDLAP
ncbi:hypothetical protein ACQEVI_09505 [Promicromonospora sp. CA-289599]|uniref:hypothetical protein n=1 Tax=Promicromonospora sp. CA-289599 TaxID=3240014 RepID=UPI003D8BD119